MKTDDAPFYLAVNSIKSGSCKPWFKKAPVGLNKLNTLMKTMALKTGLGPNFKNHSGRKTVIQTLVNNDVPSTDIMQLSGHKNVQSITSYSTLSQKQQLNMSRTLTGLNSGEIAPQSGSSIPEKGKHEFDELTHPDGPQNTEPRAVDPLPYGPGPWTTLRTGPWTPFTDPLRTTPKNRRNVEACEIVDSGELES